MSAPPIVLIAITLIIFFTLPDAATAMGYFFPKIVSGAVIVSGVWVYEINLIPLLILKEKTRVAKPDNVFHKTIISI